MLYRPNTIAVSQLHPRISSSPYSFVKIPTYPKVGRLYVGMTLTYPLVQMTQSKHVIPFSSTSPPHTCLQLLVRELVDSLCEDDADMPIRS